MPIAKDVGLDFELVAENPFDRIAAVVELGIDVLDRNPRLRPPPRMQTARPASRRVGTCSPALREGGRSAFSVEWMRALRNTRTSSGSTTSRVPLVRSTPVE